MKTDVAILHHDTYPAHVRDEVSQKLQDLIKFYDRTESIRGRLERQHDGHRVELVAAVRRGVVLVVEGRAKTLDQALDQALTRMARVLSRHKERLTRVARRQR